MKIAVVSQACATHSGSRVAVELAKALAKLGQEVIFYAHSNLSNHQAVFELKSANVKVKLIKSPPIKLFGKFIGGLTLASDLKQERVEVISSHTTLPFLIGAKLSGVPIILTYHGTQLDSWFDKIFPKNPNRLDCLINSLLNFLLKLFTRIQLTLANQIVSISSYCSQEIANFYHLKSSYIYWGARPTTFPKQPKLSKNNRKTYLLAVSRFVPYKGFHHLIEIVKELSCQFNNLELTLIGSYPNKKYFSYLEKIRSQNVKIVVDPNDSVLAQNYQRADIYLSYDKFLFFGEPVFEAASFGKPTIVFNYASALEVVKNGKTGIVAKNKKEFIKALKKLISNPKERLLLGKNAKKSVEKYTWENCAQTYLNMFKKLS